MNVHVPELAPDFTGTIDGPLQLVQVVGDAMHPTYRGWRDFVMVAPTSRFLYDHLYVIRDEHFGTLLTYRVSSAGRGNIALIRDNPRYGDTAEKRSDLVPKEWFNRQVFGIVVASIQVHDEDIIREAWAGRWK